jgi:hypothetical protein
MISVNTRVKCYMEMWRKLAHSLNSSLISKNDWTHLTIDAQLHSENSLAAL